MNQSQNTMTLVHLLFYQMMYQKRKLDLTVTFCMRSKAGFLNLLKSTHTNYLDLALTIKNQGCPGFFSFDEAIPQD